MAQNCSDQLSQTLHKKNGNPNSSIGIKKPKVFFDFFPNEQASEKEKGVEGKQETGPRDFQQIRPLLVQDDIRDRR